MILVKIAGIPLALRDDELLKNLVSVEIPLAISRIEGIYVSPDRVVVLVEPTMMHSGGSSRTDIMVTVETRSSSIYFDEKSVRQLIYRLTEMLFDYGRASINCDYLTVNVLALEHSRRKYRHPAHGMVQDSIAAQATYSKVIDRLRQLAPPDCLCVSPELREIFHQAILSAYRFNNTSLHIEHLLIGIREAESGIADQLLKHAPIAPRFRYFDLKCSMYQSRDSDNVQPLRLADEVKQLLVQIVDLSNQLGCVKLDDTHLLWAMVTTDEQRQTNSMFEFVRVDRLALKQSLESYFPHSIQQ